VLPSPAGNGSDNVLTGNSGNNNLYGFGGDDTLVGGDGIDCLDSDAGSDALYAGNDNDILYGGDGSDLGDAQCNLNACFARATTAGDEFDTRPTNACTSSPVIGEMSIFASVASARKRGSFIVATKAARTAFRR